MSSRLIAVLILCSLLSACNSGPSDAPPLAPVTGVVTLDGTPLTQGTVQFTPDSSQGTSGRMALGAIQPDGSFTMMTYTNADGAQVGFHQVTIECYESTPFNPEKPEMSEARSLIPKRYTNPAESGLRAEVKAEGPNEFRFELTSK